MVKGGSTRTQTTRGLPRGAIALAVFVAGCSNNCNTVCFLSVTAFTPSVGSGSGGENDNNNDNNNNSNNEPANHPSIEDAIYMCRSKIAESDADHPSLYPKTRMRLAVMLEHVSPETGTYDAEILNLYETAATNETLRATEQISAWTNAARFSHDSVAKRHLLSRALAVLPGDSCDSDDADADADQAAHHTRAFGDYVRSLLLDCDDLTQRIHGDSESARSSRNQLLGLLREGLELCDYAEDRLIPREALVDEYRGVLLRKTYKSVSPTASSAASVMILDAEGAMGGGASQDRDGAGPLQVYEAYSSAATKSHSKALRIAYGVELPYGKLPPPSGPSKRKESNASSIEDSCTDLLRYIILVAAAAREARLSNEEDVHLRFGTVLIESELGEFIDRDTRVEFWNAVGISFKARGDSKVAGRMFRRALEVDPEDGHAKVQLASLGDKTAASSTSLSADYVSGLFDAYSDRFERELVDVLDYTGHTMVADAVRKHVPPSFAAAAAAAADVGPWTMIDLGCGTGLLGSLFREFCPPNTVVWGADLSHRMVRKSRGRTMYTTTTSSSSSGHSDAQPVYDEVSEMDVVEFVAKLETNSAHVVGASDVLIYVGDLNELFHECHRVLLPDGLLAFTVEFPSPSETAARRRIAEHGVGLLESGRFGHSRNYIEGLARKYRYKVLEFTEGVLRKQGHENVPGAVTVLQKQP